MTNPSLTPTHPTPLPPPQHTIDPKLFTLEYGSSRGELKDGQKRPQNSQIFKRVEDYNLEDALNHVQELPAVKIRASRTMLAEMIYDEYINENGVTTICIPFEIKQDIEDKLKMLQENKIKETDEEIVTYVEMEREGGREEGGREEGGRGREGEGVGGRGGARETGRQIVRQINRQTGTEIQRQTHEISHNYTASSVQRSDTSFGT